MIDKRFGGWYVGGGGYGAEVGGTGNIRYDLQEVPGDSAEKRLIYCAISRYDDSWRSIPHSHAHAELFYCLGGRGFLRIGDEKLPIDANDFFLINPSVEHTELSDEQGMLEYIVIGVSGVRFASPQGSYPRYYLLNDRTNNAEILPYFQDVLREISRQRDGYLSVCLGILDVLLAKVSRYTRVDMNSDSPVKGMIECTEVKRLIDERFAEPLTLDWLAERAHISKFYLSRVFHRHYGASPMSYLCLRRLSEACHLLRATDHSLAAVSALSGFTSQSYFSQAFKRVYHVSPSEYRRIEEDKKKDRRP